MTAHQHSLVVPALPAASVAVTVMVCGPSVNAGKVLSASVQVPSPYAPVLDPINATDPVSGTAEPGSTVTVSFPDGTTATVVACTWQ
jgi:hypothetical protein